MNKVMFSVLFYSLCQQLYSTWRYLYSSDVAQLYTDNFVIVTVSAK